MCGRSHFVTGSEVAEVHWSGGEGVPPKCNIPQAKVCGDPGILGSLH